MSLLGNLIWLVFGGFFMSLSYLVLGFGYCVTIIGIPIGLQLFKLARLSLFPFGSEVSVGVEASGCGFLLLNLFCIVFGGLEMALAHAFLGLLFCITIVGIPFGMQHFKLARLALTPFGRGVL